MRRWLAAGFVVTGAVLSVPGTPALAQEGGERIERYSVAIAVRESGRIEVTETIDYDFGPEQRHGIYRTIPVRFRYDGEFDRVYPIDRVRVTGSRGTPTDVDRSRDGGNEVIRIGDEDRTITGRHRYVITYQVRGALNRFDSHDELFWNAIGVEWAVPIGAAEVDVTADGEVGEVACFAGPEGSRLGCARSVRTGNRATFRHGRLGSYEGMTVVVALPREYAAEPGPLLERRWSVDRAFSRTPATIGLTGLVLVAALGAVGRLAWRTGRDRRFAGEIPGLEPPPGVAGDEQHQPLFADPAGPIEYAPPDGMRPALMGVLIDETADPLDVTATIVDLAVRRYLVIEELPRKGLFRRRDWRLTELTPAPVGDELTPWEGKLLRALFAGRTSVDVSDLKNQFHTHLAEIQEALYEDAVARGWFTRRPDQDRSRWQLVGFAVAGAGGGITYVLARWTTFGLVGIPIVLAGLLVLALHRKLPFRTARGSAALARALGFRRYLATAEAEQLRWEEREGIFARYLPYAVVLGQTERWARAFERLGADPGSQLYWYSGPSGWSAGDFSDSIGDFSTAASGTISATPGSSGGSGFGGSSGGGGGGGGGGSW